jgi:SecD/SecF fusion protein
MLRFSTSKVVATLAVVLIGLLLAVPSMMTREQRDGLRQSLPGWIPSWILPTRAIVLGLDLQGGSHVLLEVDVQDLMRTQTTALRDDIRRILREQRVNLQGGIQVTPRGAQIRVPDATDRQKIMTPLLALSQPIGNAVIGGAGNRDLAVTENPDGLITLAYTDAGVNEKVRRAVDQAIEVLRRRVDALGTTEPNIQRQGSDRILVQVPGLQDPQRLKQILGQTAKLEFRLLAQQIPTCFPPATPAASGCRSSAGSSWRAATSSTRSPPSTRAPTSRSSISASTSAGPSASGRRPRKRSAGPWPSSSTTR